MFADYNVAAKSAPDQVPGPQLLPTAGGGPGDGAGAGVPLLPAGRPDAARDGDGDGSPAARPPQDRDPRRH